MSRKLSALGLAGSLVVTVLFAMWDTHLRERSVRASDLITPAFTVVAMADPAARPAEALTETPTAAPTVEPACTPTREPTFTPQPGAVTSTAALTEPAVMIRVTATVAAPRPTMLAEPGDSLISQRRTPTPPPPESVNGVRIDQFVSMPDNVKANMHVIYERGLARGNDPRAFSKMGDSTIENPYFLAPFDGSPYNLGEFAYLKPVIDYFAGSYGRHSLAVRVGLHSWSMLNPMWADKTNCQPNESPAACEFRVHKPVLVLIRLGANDAETLKLFEDNMRQIITYTMESGVIPVLGTKADRWKDPDNRFNNMIRSLAAEYQIPLWDFDLVAQTIPGSGLGEDLVHMTAMWQQDYTLPEAFKRGHSVHNLTALIVLDKLWRELAHPNR